MRAFRFVYITDTHVMGGHPYRPRVGDWEMDPEASLARVVDELINLDDAPAFVVIGGDLVSPDVVDRARVLGTEDYLPSYHRLNELLAPIGCPIHMVLGNHDHRPAFHRAMDTGARSPEAPHRYSFDWEGCHFVICDSHVPGQHGGAIDSDQLAWLQADLLAQQGSPTVVFVHHPPCPIGHRWADEIGLGEPEAFLQCLESHPQVRWVMCGHVHMDHHVQRGALSMLTSASTCFQLDKVGHEPTMLPGPPSFRIVEVDGATFSSRTVHLRDEEPTNS